MFCGKIVANTHNATMLLGFGLKNHMVEVRCGFKWYRWVLHVVVYVANHMMFINYIHVFNCHIQK